MSDLETWLPQLSTIPSATTAYDIEAASVMRTIKELDRRFGNTSKSNPMDLGEIRDDEEADPVGQYDTKEDEWIAYAPDLQANGKP